MLYFLAHSDAGIEASQTSPALVGYLCYLYLGLHSALGNNKDILLMVGFNYNLASYITGKICNSLCWNFIGNFNQTQYVFPMLYAWNNIQHRKLRNIV